ncbi:MAG: sugar phosphate isomerase/epimerase [Planctomycetes bacterium]|nr:sugar phosphate isomerase/epimerase [Planctomycetota bacterium]
MRIQYVVSTMVFWGRENHLSFEQECEFLKSQGFGIELWPNIKGHPECRYAKRNWPRLIDATSEMLVSMRSRGDNPTLEQWAEQIECAKLLNATIITSPHSLGIPDGPDLNGCGYAADVVGMAEQNNVKLCLENGSLTTLLQVGKRFSSLQYCLDTGHANIDPQFTFKQYVDELSPKVTHLHLTDNYGRTDDHEPPGLRGGIPRENWEYLLSALNKYDNDIVGSFEMFPCMPAVMLRQASEFLFDELNWPNKPQKQPGHENVAYRPT